MSEKVHSEVINVHKFNVLTDKVAKETTERKTDGES
jgi:hypothetical protein